MIKRSWKVYGADGHRQRESFSPSYKYDFSGNGKTRIIEVENADKTGTNDFSIIRITRDTAEECEEELEGQLFDGIFENSRTGKIEEIKDGENMKRYCVYFEDAETGAKSEIDIITVENGYTPEMYVEDCDKNGVEWGNGEITFSEIED